MADPPPVGSGAQDRASPNVMGLASLGLEIGIFCDSLYSVLPLNVILGLDFFGRALSRPQVGSWTPGGWRFSSFVSVNV